MNLRISKIRHYVEKFKNIADLGIGKGYYYERVDLSKKNIWAVDGNKNQVSRIKMNFPSIKVFQGDVKDPILPEKTFDLVILSQILEHIEDYEPVLKETKRICKSGGYFLVGVPLEDHHKLHFHPVWSEEKIKEVGDKLGQIISLEKAEDYWTMYVRNVEIPESEDYEEMGEPTKEYVSVIYVHYAQDEERSAIAKASLKSLLGTIHTPVEMIVVDNGNSLEDSEFFLQQVQEKKIALYFRNADNMHFTYARNQAMPEVTGKYVAIVDNDIIYRDFWLEVGIKCLTHFKDKKLIYSPINYPYVHKRDARWRHGQLEVKGRVFNLTERAGSNCMLMRRETFDEMGKFDLHKKSGCLYTDKLVDAGYLVISPGVNWAFDAGLRRGINFNKDLIIERTLSDGSKIKFNG